MRFNECCARYASRASSSDDHVIDFVQHLLEPQLVDLVNDDEEHFVMLGAFRARPLQLEQLVDREVAAVGDGGVLHRQVSKESAVILPET